MNDLTSSSGKGYRIVFAVTLLMLSTAIINLSAAPAPKPTDSAVSLDQAISTGPFAGLTLNEVLTTDYKEMKKEHGVKLNLFERFALKRAQKTYKKFKNNPEKAKRLEKKMAQAADGSSKFGLIGMILGIVGFILIWFPFVGIIGLLLLIAAFVLGIVGLKRDAKPGMSIAAIVLGSLGILIGLLTIIAAIALV